jgi:hypothetical protein
MIVYNVQRRWFAQKLDAETYRIFMHLKPSALLKVEINGRDDLSALLNALCNTVVSGTTLDLAAGAVVGVNNLAPLLDRAFVPPSRDIPDCVPDFLLKAHGITR